MKIEFTATPQATSHYSLVGMMYGRQFSQDAEFSGAVTVPGDAAERYLAYHIEDYCDCV